MILSNSTTVRNKEEEKIQSDFITNKILIVFTVAFVAIFGMFNLHQTMSYGTTIMLGQNIMNGVLIALAVVLVAGIAKMFYEKSKNVDTNLKIFTGKHISIVALDLLIAFSMLNRYSVSTHAKYAYVFLIASAVLYLIYHSYPGHFTLSVAISVFTAVAVDAFGSNVMFLSISLICVLIYGAMIYLVNTQEALAKIKTLLKMQNFCVKSFFISIAVMAVVLIGTILIIPSNIAMYLVCIYIFVTAVYNTVKMM